MVLLVWLAVPDVRSACIKCCVVLLYTESINDEIRSEVKLKEEKRR